MNSKKLWYWVGGVAFLIIFWGLVGHLVMPKHIDLRKPVNYDKPKHPDSLSTDTAHWVLNHSELTKLDTAD